MRGAFDHSGFCGLVSDMLTKKSWAGVPLESYWLLVPEYECRTSFTVLVHAHNAYLFYINNLMVVRPKKSRHGFYLAPDSNPTWYSRTTQPKSRESRQVQSQLQLASATPASALRAFFRGDEFALHGHLQRSSNSWKQSPKKSRFPRMRRRWNHLTEPELNHSAILSWHVHARLSLRPGKLGVCQGAQQGVFAKGFRQNLQCHFSGQLTSRAEIFATSDCVAT